MKISVLMPVYNVGAYVAESIESILNQTYSNFELIIIDDCSTDNTVDMCLKYQLIDSRVILVRNERNLGISGALNEGLAKASGELVARVDGDDLIDRSKFSKLVSFLFDNPDYGLIGTWIKNIDSSGELLNSSKYPVGHEEAVSILPFSSPVLHIWVARMEIYRKLKGYRSTNPAEDYDFLLRVVANGYKIGNYPEYLSYIRHRNDNTYSTAGLKQRLIFNYLRRNFLNGNIEGINLEDIEKIKRHSESGILSLLHNQSSKFLVKGFSSKNKFSKFLFLLLSAISPYTIQDFYRRVRFKQISKKW
ncbi:glycosyltransferase family 2 protein [Vibrio parahaemolyticus]|uniref:glycosyltransferase family 2 protein n=2 Tax=Vibrio parahaemolyticus TaxID=670 RepID=UPI00193DB172|nr:glycosyltransferase family 2 protein [Vibrio parahaemolyticus]EGQ8954712.1 glycosyltransferase [Vibrio parahaemolyticus]EGQ8989020.1 glycosyltransferase [Vibrio parahaemolyticus]EGQ9008277.1 glycosyltransferase [Vibrio parahaemolyticus]EJC6870937.1 glycosyltransferase family 2 protein [Vibrio parahaemolyticus]EKA7399795.1 glycosyltransferase family 2 protein [Vibrio parahaemolyticus]